MKKYILLTVVVCILFCILCAYIPKIFGVDEGNDIPIDAILTCEYNLAELRDFFKNRDANMVRHPDHGGILFFNELDAQFPVEVIRGGENVGDFPYSAYKVAEGGYYYVFWTWAYPQDADTTEPHNWDTSEKEHMCVYYSAYVKADKSRSDFATLTPEISTADDVRRIDADAEFVSLSQGRFSCILLDEKRVLEIKYSYDSKAENMNYFECLVIKEIDVVKIEESVSCFRYVQKTDFP